ncbi:MAG: response regulator [Bacteroidota bacterium]
MKKVLIIEDDTALAGTIQNFLKLKGFEVFYANNGAVGIQLAFSALPDAIICDINIPVVDGYQVYKILSETTSTYSIPFIFLTAKTSLVDIRAGMQLGVDDYITKPFDFNDLYNALVTRIAKREKIVRTSEDKFNSLLNNSPFPAFVCQEEKFIVVNRKMADLFGHSQVEMLNKCLLDFTEEKDKLRLKAKMDDCISNHEKEFNIEIFVRNKFQKKIALKLIGGYSYFKGVDCVVGSIINLSSDNYSLKDIALSTSDLEELGKAIEVFSSDYNIISRDLVEKLSGIFEEEEREQQQIRIELSVREKEVLNEICLGKSTNEIAESLFISDRTVEKHRAAIVQKTSSKNMIEAVIFAIKNKLVEI